MQEPQAERTESTPPTRLPAGMRFLFQEVDLASWRPDEHPDHVMARILERGRLVDVQWLIEHYGMARIHRFFRDVGHVELSPRTLTFWRCALDAKEEAWAEPPAWKRRSSAPWQT